MCPDLIIFAIMLLSKTTYSKPLRNTKRSYPDVDAIGTGSAEAPEEPIQDEGLSQQVT